MEAAENMCIAGSAVCTRFNLQLGQVSKAIESVKNCLSSTALGVDF